MSRYLATGIVGTLVLLITIVYIVYLYKRYNENYEEIVETNPYLGEFEKNITLEQSEYQKNMCLLRREFNKKRLCHSIIDIVPRPQDPNNIPRNIYDF